FLLKALAFYQEFAREHSADPTARAAEAEAEHRAAQIHLRLGELADAEQAYRRSVNILELLVAEFPAVPGYRNGLAVHIRDLGDLLLDSGRHAESEWALRRAVTLHEALVAEYPTVPAYRRGQAASENKLAVLLKATGRSMEEERASRRAVEIQ